MARFYIGQPVICVDDRLRPHVVRRFPSIVWPVAGRQYVIRANIANRGMTFVLLREIKNSVIRYPGSGKRAEAGFHEDRFEPATDIGVLERTARQVEQWIGDFVDEPDDHPTDEPSRKKETVE